MGKKSNFSISKTLSSEQNFTIFKAMRWHFVTLLFLCGLLGAQPVELVHSDLLESLSGGDIVILKGSVHLKHLGRELYSDFSRWNKRTGVVSFDGNVEIVDTGYTILADILVYRRRSQTADARGNVRFTSADSALFASGKSGFYDGGTEFVRLTEGPHLTRIDSTGARLELDAVTLWHFMDSRLSVAVDSVVVVLNPADTTLSPLLITCDSLEFYDDSNFVSAFGDVRIVQDSLTASAPTAYLWRTSGKVLLVDGAVIQDPNWTMWADTLWTFLSDDRLTSAKAVGEPRGKWHDPLDTLHLTDDSHFSADEMFFNFESGRIVRVDMVQRAAVDYFPAPTDTALLERHIVSGDSIAVLFAENRIDSVEVHGGVQGISYRTRPEKKDSIIYSAELMALTHQRRVHLYSDGHVHYGTMQLWAGQIHFDGDKKLLTAKPLWIDDSLTGEPFMLDENDSLRSEELAYNIETKRGKLLYGRTAADKGYFIGKHAVKAEGDTFYIADATFTTCEQKTPHYHFFTPNLKLIPRDKAIVRPVYMYVDRLPVLWLPYFIFSVKPKRHSGLLTMDIGKFEAGKRFVRNLGYYLVINDYLDVYGALDIDENQGIYIKGETKYALRYHFSGNLFGSYKLTSRRDWDTGHSVAKRWEIRGSHRHNIGERGKFSGSLSLVSDADYLTQTHEEAEERMDRTMRSYASFTQSFDWGSFSASMDRTENIDDKTITLYLPKLSLLKYSGAIFGTGESWYNKLYLSANSDMVGYSHTDEQDSTERHYGMDADAKVTFSHSFGDYMTLSPSLSVLAVIMDKAADGGKLPMLASYSFSARAATDLYGNIPAGIFGTKYFHHIVSPSLSFSFSPEVEDHDKFYCIPGISVPSGQKSVLLQFNLGQQFGLKLVDSLGTITRIALFSISSGGSYNFIAEKRKFSDITTTIRAQPLGWLSLTASLIHTLYSGDELEPSGLYPTSAKLNSSARFKFTMPFREHARNVTLTLSHYLLQNIQSGARTHWVKTGMDAFVTPNWRIGYDIYYDIEQGSKVSDEIHIWRDMHCWELTFVWVPEGIRAGYYVRLNIKELPEIKIERTEGGVRWR